MRFLSFVTTSSLLFSGRVTSIDFFNRGGKDKGVDRDSFDSASISLLQARSSRFEKVGDYSRMSIYQLFSERERVSFFGDYSEQRFIEGLIKNKFIPKSLFGYIKQKFEEADQVIYCISLNKMIVKQ